MEVEGLRGELKPGAVIALPAPQPYACRNRNALGPACQYTHDHPNDAGCAGCWWHRDRINDSG